MSDNDVEDVSFLPGDNLNRKSRYEPSVKQKCKRLVLGQGRATAIVVILGIFILIITVIASLARPGSSGSCPQSDKPLTTRSPSQEKQYKDEHGKTFPWQDIRLPKTLLPEQYHIFLHPDLLNKKFTGEVTITIRVKTSTDMVILHSRKLSIDKCEVMLFNEDRKVRKIGVEKTSMQSTLEMLAIHLEEKIASGKTIVVNIKFHAKLENKLTGFYLSSFRTPDGRTEYLGVTQFEAVGARQAFPCFDEPEMKAKFSLSIVREKNQITLFNMPLDRTNAHETDKQLEVDSYPETVKMSSYLVAFAVLSGYGSISGSTKQGTKVGVYAPKFQMNQTDHALKSAITILNFYDDWFGIKYPLPKQDLVAIPDFAAGAMENWGLITYRLVEILYDPDVSSIYRKQRVTTVIAHELAHQWFGNLVTMKWWDDLWLNEGFATFVEYLGTDKVDPSFQVMQQFLSGDMLRALESDSLRNSHPVSATVKDPNQIDSIFDAISYSKGSSIIRMAKGFIGDANFKEGLRSYLNTYKYGNAESTDLWNSLHKAYDKKDVSAVMDTWTKQMGYPVITVTKDKGGSTATLSQKRFLLGDGESTQSSPFGYKWYVPFWYTIKPEKGGFKDSLVWLNMDSATIKIPPGSKFIKGNYGMLGFYRVNYDEDNWNAINKALMENHKVLEPEDRAGIVDDLFALARSNEVSQSLALNMTRYLKSEDSYIVWHAALKGFHFLDHMLYSKDAFDILKAYVLGLMENALQKIGWEPPKTVLDSYLQQELLKRALYYDHQKTKEEARRKFRDWKDKDEEVVPNVKFVVYSAGVKYGDHKDWEFVMNKYITSTVPSEKMTLLSALAATQNIRRVEKLLEYSLDSTKIRPQDFSHVIRYLAGNPTAHLTTWHFVRTNWDNIMKMLNGAGFVIKSIIKSTTGRFAAEFDLNEVKSFFDSHEAGSGAGQVRQSIESIKMNIAWKKQNLLTVTQWLQDNSKEQ